MQKLIFLKLSETSQLTFLFHRPAINLL